MQGRYCCHTWRDLGRYQVIGWHLWCGTSLTVTKRWVLKCKIAERLTLGRSNQADLNLVGHKHLTGKPSAATKRVAPWHYGMFRMRSLHSISGSCWRGSRHAAWKSNNIKKRGPGMKNGKNYWINTSCETKVRCIIKMWGWTWPFMKEKKPKVGLELRWFYMDSNLSFTTHKYSSQV